MLTLAAIGAFSMVAFAGNSGDKNKSKSKSNSPVTIEYSEEGKVKLKVLDNNGGKVSLEIFEPSGKKMFEESISYDKSFSMPINLSGQDEGLFKFVVRGEGIEHEQEVFNSKLHKEDVFARISKVSENVYNVKVLHAGTPVLIRILNEDGKQIYSKRYLQEGNFQQRFDLSNFDGQLLSIAITGQKSYIRATL